MLADEVLAVPFSPLKKTGIGGRCIDQDTITATSTGSPCR